MATTNPESDPRRQEWATPPEFIDWITSTILPVYSHSETDSVFTLDVCATADNRVVQRFIGPPHSPSHPDMVAVDGLSPAANWLSAGFAWCNPGYASVLPWFIKAREQAAQGARICVLTHAQHSTQWHRYAHAAATAVWLINPRINFIPAPGITSSQNNKDNVLWVFTPVRPAAGAAYMYPDAWRRGANNHE